jgi:hypothetical protein
MCPATGRLDISILRNSGADSSFPWFLTPKSAGGTADANQLFFVMRFSVAQTD